MASLGLGRVLVELPDHARQTLTWDQGPEMASHAEIAHLLRDGIFFAYPGRPWGRGTNENTNGLLRQYFPKSTDLSRHTTCWRSKSIRAVGSIYEAPVNSTVWLREHVGKNPSRHS